MPETQNSETSGAAAKNAGESSQQSKRTAEAGGRQGEQATRGAEETIDRTVEAGRRQTEEARRAAEEVIDRTAEASQEALRANQEIFRTNVETAQEAMRAGMEASADALDRMTTSVTRAFSVSQPDGRVAEQSAQTVRAVSQASTALARGAKEASREWLNLVQQTARTNLEAVSQLAGCRNVQDFVAVQSNLARQNLQRMIDGGDKIARSTTNAVEEANRAMQSAPQQGQAAGR